MRVPRFPAWVLASVVLLAGVAGGWPMQALVSSCTNGRVGYLPTREAFQRGGYETTFGPSSMLAPEAGALIVQVAGDLTEQVTSFE